MSSNLDISELINSLPELTNSEELVIKKYGKHFLKFVNYLEEHHLDELITYNEDGTFKPNKSVKVWEKTINEISKKINVPDESVKAFMIIFRAISYEVEIENNKNDELSKMFSFFKLRLNAESSLLAHEVSMNTRPESILDTRIVLKKTFELKKLDAIYSNLCYLKVLEENNLYRFKSSFSDSEKVKHLNFKCTNKEFRNYLKSLCDYVVSNNLDQLINLSTKYYTINGKPIKYNSIYKASGKAKINIESAFVT